MISTENNLMEQLGLVEVGGGDDFYHYVLQGATQHVFYVFDDGHWEYRDFSVCTDDSSEPIHKGRTEKALRRVIRSLRS